MIREEQRIIALHFRHVTFQAAIDLPGSAKRVVVLLRIVTLHALPDSQGILCVHRTVRVMARCARQRSRFRKALRLHESNWLEASEERIVRMDFLGFDFVGSPMTLSTPIDSVFRCRGLPEAVLNFALSGNMLCTRAVTTLACHSRVKVFQPEPAVIDGESGGMARKAAACFRVVIEDATWPQVRREMIFGLSGRYVEPIKAGIPSPAKFQQICRALAVRER